MDKKLTRRDFIKGAAAGSLGLAVAGLTGMVSATAESTEVYTPGTYSAVVQGYSSFITVEVTFSATDIIGCNIDASGETPAVGGAYAAEYAQKIVEQQNIDAVTSATASLTSPAIKAAVSNCIAQAKGTAGRLDERAKDGDTEDWLGSAPDVASLDIVQSLSTDLLIVGAGNGGMMAAATAADAGMDFIICEQNTVPADTRYWVGAVNTDAVKELGLEVDKTRLMNELGRYASYKCNMDVIRLWVDHSAETVSYLESLGMMAIPQPAPEGHVGGVGAEYYVPTIWHIVTTPEELENSELPVMTGERNRHLERHIQEKGYEVQYSMTLVCLTQDENGAVDGAIFTNAEGSYVRIHAKNVILATGGYPGNPKMLKALSPIAMETITGAYFNGSDRGMGIRAGLWAGASKNTEPALMIFDRGIVPPGAKAGYVEDENGNLRFPSPDASFILGSQPFLKVNKRGRRFINESLPYDFANYAASFQPDGVYACIVDSNVNEDVLAYDQYGCAQIGVYIAKAGGVIPTLESFMPGGLVFKADTIEELADQLGLPQDELTATVSRYNDLCEKGVDEDFGKEPYRMRPIMKAPYYGFFLGGALLTTMDGLRINGKCQVLDSSCNVIDGLYCVGDCSGSFFSGNYPEYMVGCAVGHTITEGRYAVKAILGEEF